MRDQCPRRLNNEKVSVNLSVIGLGHGDPTFITLRELEL